MPILFDNMANFLHSSHHRSAVLGLLMYMPEGALNDGHDYLDIDDETGNISYYPKAYAEGRQQVGYYDASSSRRRRSGRPARILRTLLPEAVLERLNETDFELAANVCKAWTERNNGEFREVPADQIPFWYHEDRHAVGSNTGSLGSSCMRYEHCQPFLDFYSLLAGHVSLLIYVNGDERVLGRALVWEKADGRKVLDRIYGSDHMIRLFQTYAQEQGWHYRRYNSYERPTRFMSPEGREVDLDLTFTLPSMPNLHRVPYMDTVKYLNLSDHTVSNFNDTDSAHAVMNGTRGNSEFLSAFFDHPDFYSLNRRLNYEQIAEKLWEAGDAEEAPEAVVEVEDEVMAVSTSRLSSQPSPQPTVWYQGVPGSGNIQSLNYAEAMRTLMDEDAVSFRDPYQPLISFDWATYNPRAS